jgi:hypothetical protein
MDIGAIVAAVLVLMVLTYLVWDNPLYRIAVHLFVGVTAGYAVVVVLFSVLWPQMLQPLVGAAQNAALTGAFNDWQNLILPIVALVFALLLLIKPQVWPGGIATAFMVGVGAAVAVGGAVVGTLLPQTSAAAVNLLPVSKDPAALLGINWEKALDAGCMLIGGLATVGFFFYWGRPRAGRPSERPLVGKWVAWVGQVFIGITFGVMYAGAIAAGVAVFAQSLMLIGAALPK